MKVLSKAFLCLISVLALSALTSCQSIKAPTSDELTQNFKDGLALSRVLAKEEAETYAGSYLSDYSCSCRVFLFTIKSHEVLGRYTDNPIFSAKQVEYSLKDLKSAKEQTRQQIAKSDTLRSAVHIELDESLNGVRLLVNNPYNSDVSDKLMTLRPFLHPSVMVLGPEDIGVVVVPLHSR